jgi:flagellar basal-body rod modification protein FlgD
MEITATQSQSNVANETAAQSTKVDQLANKETFLQLLVAQIRNQDPLNPADGMEFVTQLAQFSQLEQLIGIRNEIGGIGDSVTAPNETSDTTQETEQAAQQ